MAGAAHGFGFRVIEMGRAIALAEAGKGVVQLEAGISHFGPAPQGFAMLGFFGAPALDPFQGFWL